MCPTLDNKEGTTVSKLMRLDIETLPWSKNVPAINSATKKQEPHHIHQSISHSDMTQLWMTRALNNARQPKQERSMMPLLQTSTHYPETSKQNDQSSGNQSFGTLSMSLIQEHADSTEPLLSTMTYSTGVERSKMPPSND